MARGRREGQRNLMRMLGSATSARRRSIDRTRRESARRLKKEQREAEARAEARYRKQHRYDWLGRGIKYGLTGLSLAATGGVGAAGMALAAGGGALGGMLLPEGADPYVQQGAMAMQSMMGQRQQMAMLDQQLLAQQQHTAAILGRLGGGTRPSPYPAAAQQQQPSAWDFLGQEAQRYRGTQDPFAQQLY